MVASARPKTVECPRCHMVFDVSPMGRIPIYCCAACRIGSSDTKPKNNACQECGQPCRNKFCQRRACQSPRLSRKNVAWNVKYHAKHGVWPSSLRPQNTPINRTSPAAVAADARRRARKNGSATVKFLHTEIFDRDKWVCQLCAEPVDRSLCHPDPLSASLDHIVPLSKSGSHTKNNVQLAHLSCNIRKGSRVKSQEDCYAGCPG